MSKVPKIKSAANQHWKNWHKTLHVGGHVDKLLTPTNLYTDGSTGPSGQEFLPGLQGLQQIVDAAAMDKARVRAFGSKWSLNNVAFTHEHLVVSNELDYMKIGIEEAGFVTPAYKDKRQELSFVQCGVMVKALNAALRAKGQALSTSGASDGQTLIGAISTGTHGSANRVGAMTEYVRGIHLVIDGKHLLVQRKSDQAVTDQFCNWLGEASHVLDDDLFNAALVSFGSFGFVHGLLIETEPLYLLERIINNYDFQEVEKAITTLDMSGLGLPDGDKLPFHFEVALNPYRLGVGEKGAFVRVYYKRGIHDDLMSHVTDAADGTLDVHGAMAHAFDGDKTDESDDDGPSMSSAEGDSDKIKVLGFLVQLALRLSFPLSKPGERDIRYPGQFFTSDRSADPTSASPVPATSLEIGVPFDRIGDAVDLIHKVTQVHPFAAPLALRYVKKSTATIGFTGLAPLTVTMEMPGPFGHLLFPKTGEAHTAIFEALAASDIHHSYHWGQQLPPNDQWPPKTYGSALVSWKEQRRKLLGEAGIKMFSNEFIDAFLEPPKKKSFWALIGDWFRRRLGWA